MPSVLKTQCPQCSQKLNASDKHVGKPVRCPSCKHKWIIQKVESSDEISSLGRDNALETCDDEFPNHSSGTQKSRQFKETLGRYRLQEVLGEGSYGVVYKAYDPVLGRTIALKIPRFSSSDQARTKRFLTEAHAAANLKHPNIVVVYESGEENHQQYIASEFVEGVPFSQVIQKNPPDFQDSAAIVRSLANALSYAHHEGVIHRDIKPDNIMISGENRPQIMDFGLAKLTDEDSQMTGDGNILGTPAYMSPEQARGEKDQVGPKSDQYSLGVILFELLTGERPYSGPPFGIIAQVGSNEDSPLAITRNKEVPRDLSAICQRAMEKDPEKRYADCDEMAEDLNRWLEGYETVARPLGILEKYKRWYRRNRTTARLWTTVVSLLILIAFMSSGLLIYQSALLDQTKEQLDEKDTIQQETQRALAISYFQKGKELCEDGNVDYGLHWLNRSLSFASERDDSISRAVRTTISSWLPHLNRLKFVMDKGSSFSTVDFHPDGTMILTGGRGRVQRWNAQTGEPIGEPIPHRTPIQKVLFSPDGKMFATASWGLSIWDTETGQQIGETYYPQYIIRNLAIHPDGKQLVCVVDVNGVYFVEKYEIPGFKKLGEYIEAKPVACLEISPDGKKIAYGGQKSEIVLLGDFEDSGKPPFPLLHQYRPKGADFSPDSKIFVTAEPSGAIRFWNTETGELIQPVVDFGEGVDSVEFSPDGKTVLAGGREGLTRTISTEELSLGNNVFRTLGRITNVSYHPNGNSILISAENQPAQMWELGKPSLEEKSMPHPDQVNLIALSPDQKTIATTCFDNQLRIWDLQTGKQIGRDLEHSDEIEILTFSPDGKILATGDHENIVHLWDVKKADSLGFDIHHGKTDHQLGISDVQFSESGRYIYSNGIESKVYVTDSKTGKLLASLKGGSKIFPYRDEYIVTCNRGYIQFFKWTENRMISESKFKSHHNINPYLLSNDDQNFLTGNSKGQVQIWDIKTGEALLTGMQHPAAITAVGENSDGSQIVTACLDGIVRIWDKSTGKQVGHQFQHDRTMIYVKLIHDDQTLITAGNNQSILLWDVKSGQQMGYPLHKGKLNDAELDSNQTFFVTAGTDGTAKIWNLPTPLDYNQKDLTLWLEATTGQKMDENGNIRILKPDEWKTAVKNSPTFENLPE